MSGAPASVHGPWMDGVYMTALVISIIFFIGTQAAMIFLAWRSRERPGMAPKGRPLRSGEWIWTTLVTLILIGLAWQSRDVWQRLADYHRKTIPSMVVRVYGQQWTWSFRYPGEDGRFDTGDDLEVHNRALLPVNEVVRLELNARDVIHGFFVPDLRLHQDAVPGFTSTLTVEIKRPGTYEVRCTQFCGTDHHVMRGEIVATTPEAVAAWLRQMKENPFAN